MKTKTILFFYLFLFAELVNSQNIFVNKMWPDTSFSKHIERWKHNNNIKVKYEKINDTEYLRKDFYEEGEAFLKSKIEVKFYYCIDTGYMEDPNNPGTLVMEINRGYRDFASGAYVEYYELTIVKKQEGKLNGQNKIGEWKSWDYDGKLESVSHFDTNGNQIGSYQEYYSNGQIKWEGQFSIVRNNYYQMDFQTQKTIKRIQNFGTKTGIWNHYDETGLLLEIVKYDWKAN